MGPPWQAELSADWRAATKDAAATSDRSTVEVRSIRPRSAMGMNCCQLVPGKPHSPSPADASAQARSSSSSVEAARFRFQPVGLTPRPHKLTAHGLRCDRTNALSTGFHCGVSLRAKGTGASVEEADEQDARTDGSKGQCGVPIEVVPTSTTARSSPYISSLQRS